MAFGDKGEHRFEVAGIPFRMDGASREEAMQSLVDMLQAAPELLDQRARRLGLDEADMDALELQSREGEAGLRGKTRDVETSGLDRFRIGMGHQFLRRARGARQLFARLFGDETAVEMIAQEQRDEDEIYRKLDEKGIGLEDLGQLSADMTAFLIPGSQGLMGGAITGAALATADVRDAEDITGGELMTDAGVGAVAGALFPALGWGSSAVRGIAQRFAGGSVPVRGQAGQAIGWLRWRALRQNPGATERVVQEGLEMATQEVDEGLQIIGRAALDRVQSIVNSLPKNSDTGLRDEVAMGLVRAALRDSTEQVGRVNVFNPTKWERAMSELQGQVGGIFRRTEHTQALGSINVLAREMQALGENLPVELAERAAEALIKAPARAKPVIEAIRLASSPEVKLSLMDQLTIIAAEAAESVVTRAPGAAPRAAGLEIGQQILDIPENF